MKIRPTQTDDAKAKKAADAAAAERSVYEVKRSILRKLGGKLTVFDRPFDEDTNGLQV